MRRPILQEGTDRWFVGDGKYYFRTGNGAEGEVEDPSSLGGRDD